MQPSLRGEVVIPDDEEYVYREVSRALAALVCSPEMAEGHAAIELLSRVRAPDDWAAFAVFLTSPSADLQFTEALRLIATRLS